MLDILAWLIAVEIIGLLAFPVAFALLPWLPDRGYSLAKALGLLMVFYPLWLLGSTSVIPNSLITIAFTLAAVTLISLSVVWLRQNEIAEFVSRERGMILLSEIVCLGVFAIWVYVKIQDPSIDHTEQPMDFAFLNASIISRSFPPQDPWLAGSPVNYYYFGYLIMGGLTRLTGVTSSVSYNLALALIPALVAVAAFGIGSNLVRVVGGSLRAAVLSGLAAVLLLIGLANLESGLEFLRASGVGSGGWWEWVDIKGLDGPSESMAWHPSESGWWWWRATRVIDTVQEGVSRDYTITEFPFFSYLLGDLHPHVMSMPFVILFIGIVLNVFLSPVLPGLGWMKRNGGLVALLAFSLGALGFINLWDLPTFATLLALTMLARGYRERRTISGAIAVALPVVATVILLAVVLYLPFYANFHSPAEGILPVKEPVTRYFHFGVIWGLFLLILVPFLVWEVMALIRRRPWGRRDVLFALGIPVIPLGAWALAPFGMRVLVEFDLPFVAQDLKGLAEPMFTWDLSQMPGLLVRRLVHLLPLLGLMAVSLYVLLRYQRSNDRQGNAFPMLLLVLGSLLLLVPELFHVVDLFNNRMNTMFKLYYQTWVLLALASSFALYSLGARYTRSRLSVRVGGYAWIALAVVGLMAALYYPIASVQTKATDRRGEITLDGLAYLGVSNPDELRAIEWLRENFRSGDRIIEAVGSDYIAETSRVSASTGIPTVLGWPGHEHQWWGSTELFEGREEEVKLVYQSADIEQVREILRRYGVSYVYVGPRERDKYGTAGLEKFDRLGELAFAGDGVTIYRFRG